MLAIGEHSDPPFDVQCSSNLDMCSSLDVSTGSLLPTASLSLSRLRTLGDFHPCFLPDGLEAGLHPRRSFVLPAAAPRLF